jgi:hypothetical protein
MAQKKKSKSKSTSSSKPIEGIALESNPTISFDGVFDVSVDSSGVAGAGKTKYTQVTELEVSTSGRVVTFYDVERQVILVGHRLSISEYEPSESGDSGVMGSSGVSADDDE